MKKILFIIILLFLIIITTLTKNSTKTIDQKIYETKENIRLLKDKYELVLLDYNFLSSPEKLMNYQRKYFDNELLEIDIRKIKKISIDKDNLTVEKIVNNIDEAEKK
tara:strand:+ start:1844 stop:2164 length:321 start_codon:yes stop_codon:yes gene_type:complete